MAKRPQRHRRSLPKGAAERAQPIAAGDANEVFISAHVERALEAVRQYLGARQAEAIRRLLRKNIETDPVSLRLLANATNAKGDRPRAAASAAGKRPLR